MDINTGSGPGVYGSATQNFGVLGTSGPDAAGVAGIAKANGIGVYGVTVSGTGVFGFASSNGFGVHGQAGYNAAVYGEALGTSSTSNFGVEGKSNSSSAAVAGFNGSTGAGVYGESSKRGFGIQGKSSGGSGVYGQSLTGYGVAGNSPNNYGVRGDAASNVAAIGGFNSSSGSGIYGQSSTGYGVAGYSPKNYGVRGDAASNLAAVGGFNSSSGAGVYGQSTTGYGVAGYSAAFRTVGVWGESQSGVALIAHADAGNSSPAFVVEGGTQGSGKILMQVDDSNGGVMVYSVDTGDFYVDGLLYTFGGCHTGCSRTRHVAHYGASTSVPTIDDVGEASLRKGRADVRLDPAFANTIDTTRPYVVLITPEGDSNGLYVTNKTPRGFQVRENHGGRAAIAFTYRIVAHPLGATAKRLPFVDEPKVALPPNRPLKEAR